MCHFNRMVNRDRAFDDVRGSNRAHTAHCVSVYIKPKYCSQLHRKYLITVSISIRDTFTVRRSIYEWNEITTHNCIHSILMKHEYMWCTRARARSLARQTHISQQTQCQPVPHTCKAFERCHWCVAQWYTRNITIYIQAYNTNCAEETKREFVRARRTHNTR